MAMYAEDSVWIPAFAGMTVVGCGNHGVSRGIDRVGRGNHAVRGGDDCVSRGNHGRLEVSFRSVV